MTSIRFLRDLDRHACITVKMYSRHLFRNRGLQSPQQVNENNKKNTSRSSSQKQKNEEKNTSNKQQQQQQTTTTTNNNNNNKQQQTTTTAGHRQRKKTQIRRKYKKEKKGLILNTKNKLKHDKVGRDSHRKGCDDLSNYLFTTFITAPPTEKGKMAERPITFRIEIQIPDRSLILEIENQTNTTNIIVVGYIFLWCSINHWYKRSLSTF